MIRPDFREVFQDRRIFLTGHTGFKGSWLSLWLYSLGAKVFGYALDPNTEPNLFKLARISDLLEADYRGDVSDLQILQSAIQTAAPSVVFHLAAQPLVRESYRDPIATFKTNVMGTVNLLECVRHTPSVQAVVVVTTDKVYQNNEWPYPYREVDALGGYDPYSASKASAEIVTNAYRSSFFSRDQPPWIATARAGNVIGGGDWSQDRLVPDCLRAFAQGQSVRLRNPGAVRPWQHVLDALSGYLHLASALLSEAGPHYATAWNFAPDLSGDATVASIATSLAQAWGRQARVVESSDPRQPHEAGLLRLDSTKARQTLGWTPQWQLSETVQRVVEWQTAWSSGGDVRETTLSQIRAYAA